VVVIADPVAAVAGENLLGGHRLLVSFLWLSSWWLRHS